MTARLNGGASRQPRLTGRKVRRIVATTLLVAAVPTALGTASSSASTRFAAAATINRNGVINASSTSVPNTLDPAKPGSVSPYPYLFQIYDRLTQVDTDRKLKPMLATSWSFSADGKVLTMNLRKDVKFNDGTPLTADAVKVSIERNKNVAGTVWKASLASISTVNVVNPYQVQFLLNGPGGDLPAIFASPAGIVINPKVLAQGRNLATNPGRGAGSGPRVITKFVSGDRVEFERADNDYFEPAANNVAKMTLYRISDSPPRMNSFKSGQTNVMMIKTDQIDEAKALQKAGQAKLYVTKYSASQVAMHLRATRNELDKVAVRQALNYAIDRNAIANDLMGGNCEPATQLFEKGQPGYTGGLENWYNYDPARARKLLASAGLANGFSLGVEIIAGQSPQVEIAQVVKEQLAKVGIKMNIIPVDAGVAAINFNAGQYDAFLQIVGGNPDPSLTVDGWVTGGANWSLGTPVAAQLKQLAVEGRDRTKSTWVQKYRDIAGVVTSQALYVPICFQPAAWMAKNNVVNADTMPWQTSATYDPRYLATTK